MANYREGTIHFQVFVLTTLMLMMGAFYYVEHLRGFFVVMVQCEVTNHCYNEKDLISTYQQTTLLFHLFV